jgi:hypothetical protein
VKNLMSVLATSADAHNIFRLRSETDPYIGLVDCGKKIADEEGWGALYRAWWLTGLGVLLTGLS